MDKRWYPVAFSVTVVACGGDVDDGRPSATGGAPNYHYGPALVTGGSSGQSVGFYGPKSFGGTLSAGGSQPNASGATTSGTGGSSAVDAGFPTTGGSEPIIYYMANMRLPASPERRMRHFATPFEPIVTPMKRG